MKQPMPMPTKPTPAEQTKKLCDVPLPKMPPAGQMPGMSGAKK